MRSLLASIGPQGCRALDGEDIGLRSRRVASGTIVIVLDGAFIDSAAPYRLAMLATGLVCHVPSMCLVPL
jgi:hypothetical protein